MNVGDLARRGPVCVRRHVDLVTASDAMRKGHVGCLIVTEPLGSGDGERPIGVVTDRDIVTTVIARSVEPRTLLVDDVMSRNPVVAESAQSLEHALRLMRDAGVRRLPVVDAQGRLVSVLSHDDVLEYLAEQLATVVAAIRAELQSESAVRS
jgi:CBS domain-containing protein